MSKISLLAAIAVALSGCAYDSLFDSENWLRKNKNEFPPLDASNGEIDVTFVRAKNVPQSLIGINGKAINNDSNCAFFEKNGENFLIIISCEELNVHAREYKMKDNHWVLIKEVKEPL